MILGLGFGSTSFALTAGPNDVYTRVVDVGLGLCTVTEMKIVGHKSERMHRRYNSVSEADLLAAASKINTYLTPADSADQATVVSY